MVQGETIAKGIGAVAEKAVVPQNDPPRVGGQNKEEGGHVPEVRCRAKTASRPGKLSHAEATPMSAVILM
jgi:hypothetical protein